MENVSRKPRQNRFGRIILIVAALILMAGAAIHLRFTRQMEILVVDQFNQEQLTVARIIQKLVENSLNTLEKELLQIAGKLSAPVPDPSAWQVQLQPDLDRIATAGVIDILIWERASDAAWVFSRGEPFRASPDLAPAMASEALPGPGEVLVTHPISAGSGVYIFMITPMGSGAGQFLLFRIHLSWFLAPLLKDVRSGASGYAWIIDARGVSSTTRLLTLSAAAPSRSARKPIRA